MSGEVVRPLYTTQPELEPLVAALDEVVLPNGNRLTDILKLRGVMDGAVFDINGEAYDLGQEDGGDLDEWRNVARHGLKTALITDVLGEVLGLSLEERRITNLAAVLHDSDKKTERNWQRALESDEDVAALAEGQREGLQSKESQRVRALLDVAAMEALENVEFGIPAEAAALMTVNTPKTINGPQTDMERIMWFADACLRMTTIMSAAERMESGRRDVYNGGKNATYAESFRDQFGGRNLYEVQVEIAERLIPELSIRIGVVPEHFYVWLNTKVEEKIARGQLPIF